jgi:hypothetical protein
MKSYKYLNYKFIKIVNTYYFYLLFIQMPRKSKKNVDEFIETSSITMNQLSADLSNIDINLPNTVDLHMNNSYHFLDKLTISHHFRKFLYQIKDYYCEYHEIDAEYQQNIESTIGHFMVERFYSSEKEMSAEIIKITNSYYHHQLWGVIDIIVEKYVASGNFKVIYYFSFYHQEDDLYISKIQTLVENAFVI